jgi:2-polyprenyl-3-methyl-5-hydroxy-6-metoxy-1,4-benzoquinol methylase
MLCLDPNFRETVWRHLAWKRSDGDISELRTRIHREDQMLRHSLRHWDDANRSVSQYYSVALQQYHAARQILALAHPNGTEDLAFLDFACGWGRLLRFLAHSLPTSQVWASEIQPEAVRFVQEEYGVSSVESAFDPDQFQPGREFDFIWVASLFSHLPDILFHRWLARLRDLLTPDGVLCFSVIDSRLLPPEIVMPETGIHFMNSSEIEELDAQSYGLSFVTEDYVRSAIGTMPGGVPKSTVRLRQALANEQDLYVMPKDSGRDLSGLQQFRRGAWGWVDDIDFAVSGTLHLAGWAATLDEGPAEGVEVRIGRESFEVSIGQTRDDVAKVLGDPRLAPSGWTFEHILAPQRVFVEVSARSQNGDQALLYAGWLTPA